MVSGFLVNVQEIKISEKYADTGEVQPSQKMNDLPFPILSVHCIGCKAGLAETFSLVAGVLFYIEVWSVL